MSEKRFMVFPHNVIWDNQLEEVVCRCILEGIGDAENVCQRLNEQQGIIEEKNNVIILMGAFIKSKGFSVNDFDEWISRDWHNSNERYEEHYKEH